MKYRSCDQGFTLIQLVTSVAILSIVASFSAGSWSSLTERVTATRVKSNLQDAFGKARASAVYEGKIVTLCPLNESNSCTAQWNEPVSIFVDAGSNQALANDSDLIRVIDFGTTGDLTASATPHGERRYFQYKPDGSTHGSIGNLTWCPRSKEETHAVQLILNFGGRIRWAPDTNNDGIAEDASGNPLVCS